MNQGDILLVKYPFSNLSDYKIRPALVVSNTLFNNLFDAWMCPITSKTNKSTIPIENFMEEGILNEKSFVKITSISAIHEDQIIKRVGALKKEKLVQIIDAIKKNF